MRKVLLTMMALILAGSTLVMAQWQYVEDFVEIRQPHGVVVTPDGNIWVQPFPSSTDTLDNGVTVSGLHVYDPSGLELAVVATGTLNGVPDTLSFTGRGIALDNNGNVLVSNGYLYRINYQTQEFMNRFDWKDDFWSLTEAAADANGFVYCTRVVPGGDAIFILDSDFELYNIAVDTNNVISRSLVVSPDGKELYHGAIYPGVGVIHYHSDDGPDGAYTTVDTLRGPNPDKELWGQILDVDPGGYLWVGSYWDPSGQVSDAYTGWYQYNLNVLDGTSNPGKGAFLDSLGKNVVATYPDSVPGGVVPTGDQFWAPRGIAFWEENDGSWTAYTADFDGSVVKKWTNPNPITGIIAVNDGQTLVKEFDLRQNYPNPFNPTTYIPFSLAKAAHVELTIYNVRGQKVRTLVNERMQPGKYEFEFDASGLASGTYFYRVKFDGKVQTKRMMLTR